MGTYQQGLFAICNKKRPMKGLFLHEVRDTSFVRFTMKAVQLFL